VPTTPQPNSLLLVARSSEVARTWRPRSRASAGRQLEGARLRDLRRGVVTALARAGAPPCVTSKVLGHFSVHFTANVHQQADGEIVERALAGLEEALRQ
jgi:hypothetical protein